MIQKNSLKRIFWDYAWKGLVLTSPTTDPLQECQLATPPKIQRLELKNGGFVQMSFLLGENSSVKTNISPF